MKICKYCSYGSFVGYMCDICLNDDLCVNCITIDSTAGYHYILCVDCVLTLHLINVSMDSFLFPAKILLSEDECLVCRMLVNVQRNGKLVYHSKNDSNSTCDGSYTIGYYNRLRIDTNYILSIHQYWL